jgi:hypothetical protein
VTGLIVAAVLIAALPVSCGTAFDSPGEQNYRTEATVINRTEREVDVFSQLGTINVPACGEVDVPNFPVNSWNVTSPGSDMIRSAGGHSERHSYLVVMQVVRQVDSRPDPLPVCTGVLQPAH